MPWHITIARLDKLGVSMDRVVSDLGPEQAGMLLVFALEQPQHMQKFARIMQAKGRQWEHLLSTIELLDDQLKEEE